MDVTGKGDIRPHPVYKEIRSVIKAIRAEWRASGLMQVAKDEGYIGALPAPLGDKDESLEGDREYHDRLYGNEDEE